MHCFAVSRRARRVLGDMHRITAEKRPERENREKGIFHRDELKILWLALQQYDIPAYGLWASAYDIHTRWRGKEMSAESRRREGSTYPNVF
jgi:hypothetical protein